MRLKKSIPLFLALGAIMVLLAAGGSAQAVTITVQSDASTQGVALDISNPLLTTGGDISGLVFTPVIVDSLGTFTPVPAGAPSGTAVINLPGAVYSDAAGWTGMSGLFLVTFDLPSGATNIALSGAGNVDDMGWVFLNGSLIGGALYEGGDMPFFIDNQTVFLTGTNYLLVSDINSCGGPSGAAFYATITYDEAGRVPEPGVILLLGSGLAGLASFRRKFTT
jgi:hypothetical protein